MPFSSSNEANVHIQFIAGRFLKENDDDDGILYSRISKSYQKVLYNFIVHQTFLLKVHKLAFRFCISYNI